MVSSGLATMAFSLLVARGLQEAATSGRFEVDMFKSYNDACTAVSIVGFFCFLAYHKLQSRHGGLPTPERPRPAIWCCMTKSNLRGST
mmetsp:Transcript_13293/g.53040  ORF Transcript_13293/g.53040 Transcript_13293/m.53040 type:complete len:88 (-) Transcript_13293:255-518(-)